MMISAVLDNGACAQDGAVERAIQKIRDAGLEPPAAEDITPFSDIKRFLERWNGDQKLRAAYAESPRRVGEAVGLRVDPEIVRPLWDPAAGECSEFNLVERTIKLASPCAPDERWPLGYRVYDQARFETFADVRRIVEDMVDRDMARAAIELPVLRFQSCLRFEPMNSGFALVGPYLRQRFEATTEMPLMARLGELVHSGRHSAERAIARLREEYGASPASVEAALDELFRLGVLDEGTA